MEWHCFTVKIKGKCNVCVRRAPTSNVCSNELQNYQEHIFLQEDVHLAGVSVTSSSSVAGVSPGPRSDWNVVGCTTDPSVCVYV